MAQTANQSQSPELNKENYYTTVSDHDYMSATLFKSFLSCEAATVARLKGEWRPPEGDALIVGNYLHSYFESHEAHEQFVAAHPEIILQSGKYKGQPKTAYKQADEMISALETDPTFTSLYQGQKEVIVTGDIGGVRWKGKLDCFPDNHRYFVDLKTTADIHKRFWLGGEAYDPDKRGWGSFIEAYNYPLQMAVYQELIRQQFGVMVPPLIVAVSKQPIPDKAIISIPQGALTEALEAVEAMMPRVYAVWTEGEEPKRCEACEYCRATKKLSDVPVSMTDLID